MAESAPHPREYGAAASGTLRDTPRPQGPTRTSLATLGEPQRLRARDFARTTLRPRHRAVVRAFAEALFTHDQAPDASRLDGMPDEVDGMISNASKTLRFGLCVMLDIVRWAPLFTVGKPSMFEDLRLADRVRMLEMMERGSPLQLVFVAYKTVLTMLFLEAPEELRALGYSSARARFARAPVGYFAEHPQTPGLTEPTP